MPTPTGPSSHSLASSLQPFLRLRKAKLSLGEMLDRIERGDGPGPVVFILTLPILLPLPPGVSMVLALPLLLVAPQIVIGRREIWLPKALSRRTIKREPLIALIKRILPPLERVEKIVRPRLRFLTGRVGASMVGVACTLLAVVLVLPIPFANLVPALALGAFSIGLTRKDGLFVLAGYGLIAVAIGVIVLGIHGFTLGLSHLRQLF
ncbi:MAG: exopolysaccharide biosynthesis protein [Devosia sp.]|nr:exopolysaccharide biosynthesis protein [Devosia sp.]